MSDATNSAPAIDIDGVSHSFRDRRALRNVSFQVQPRTLHGFVGPNGAGKTTALKLISTLMRPQIGRIRIFGYDTLDDAKTIRRLSGYMPDHMCMYRQMTVFEYLDFYAAAFGMKLDQRTQVIEHLLALTEMQRRQDDVINELSRGMQQRISLARVLVNDPQLLLLDEPAAGLDARARIELMDILRSLCSMGKTVVISSQILSELAELCDSLTIIDRGRIKFSGPKRELLIDDESHPTYRLRLEEDQPDLQDRLCELRGVVEANTDGRRAEYRVSYDPSQTDTNSLLRDVLQLGVSILSFTRDGKHINEAFLELTDGGIE